MFALKSYVSMTSQSYLRLLLLEKCLCESLQYKVTVAKRSCCLFSRNKVAELNIIETIIIAERKCHKCGSQTAVSGVCGEIHVIASRFLFFRSLISMPQEKENKCMIELEQNRFNTCDKSLVDNILARDFFANFPLNCEGSEISGAC